MSETRLTDLERAVLEKLLAGEHPALAALRTQAAVATAEEREMTGAGFMTSLAVPVGVSPAAVRAGTARLGDVAAEMEGVIHGAGFLLYVKDGLLDALEGYTYDEPWPEQVTGLRLTYLDPEKRDFGELQDFLMQPLKEPNPE